MSYRIGQTATRMSIIQAALSTSNAPSDKEEVHL